MLLLGQYVIIGFFLILKVNLVFVNAKVTWPQLGSLFGNFDSKVASRVHKSWTLICKGGNNPPYVQIWFMNVMSFLHIMWVFANGRSIRKVHFVCYIWIFLSRFILGSGGCGIWQVLVNVNFLQQNSCWVLSFLSAFPTISLVSVCSSKYNNYNCWQAKWSPPFNILILGTSSTKWNIIKEILF